MKYKSIDFSVLLFFLGIKHKPIIITEQVTIHHDDRLIIDVSRNINYQAL